MENRHIAPDLYMTGISHENGGAEAVGKCGVPKDLRTSAEAEILKSPKISEALILSTCNRVEIYFVSEYPDAVNDVLAVFGKIESPRRDTSDFDKLRYFKKNSDAVRHIFEVASGLQSQMTGETEILGQVKEAYARASGAKHCGGILNTVFQKANQCAKWIRTNTDIGHGKISLGSVSAELAARIFDDVSKADILLLGSGEAGKLVADALYVRGATNITVASRTRENADALAEKIGCKSADMQEALKALANFDIAICASFSREPLLDKKKVARALAKRGGKPVFLVDLSVPRNVEPDCAELEDAFLYNLDDLSKIANENIALRKSEIDRARVEISRKASIVSAKLRLQ